MKSSTSTFHIQPHLKWPHHLLTLGNSSVSAIFKDIQLKVDVVMLRFICDTKSNAIQLTRCKTHVSHSLGCGMLFTRTFYILNRNYSREVLVRPPTSTHHVQTEMTQQQHG